MKFETNKLPPNASKDELLADIRRVSAIIIDKEHITGQDYNKYGKASISRILNHFKSWPVALKEAGLENRIKRITKRAKNTNNVSDEMIIGEVKRIAELLGKTFLTHEDINFNSELISSSTVENRFGSWKRGLALANLTHAPTGSRYQEEELLENMYNVWVAKGRQPVQRELDETISKINGKVYENRFGKFSKAIEWFVTRMNSQDASNDSEQKSITLKETPDILELKTEQKPIAENSRKIPLGLRWTILKRDNFRCVIDGNSPATGTTKSLHIDHIIPWSKGGKTMLENLRVLCAECNLGRGNDC